MTDLFEQPADDQPVVDQTKNYLVELVGDDKKFKSVEDLARGKYEADQFISIQNKRFDQLREDYLKLREDHQAKANLEELIDQLKTAKTNQSENTQSNGMSQEQPPFDPNQIASLVSTEFQKHELAKMEQENVSKVKAKLTEHYGSNYQNVLKEHANSLGMSQEFVNALAKSNPTVLFKTLGVDGPRQTESFQSPPRSAQRTDNFAPKSEKHTWAYYQKMKRENPTLYADPKTAVQMNYDAMDLGEEFRDGDYYRV